MEVSGACCALCFVYVRDTLTTLRLAFNNTEVEDNRLDRRVKIEMEYQGRHSSSTIQLILRSGEEGTQPVSCERKAEEPLPRSMSEMIIQPWT